MFCALNGSFRHRRSPRQAEEPHGALDSYSAAVNLRSVLQPPFNLQFLSLYLGRQVSLPVFAEADFKPALHQ